MRTAARHLPVAIRTGVGVAHGLTGHEALPLSDGRGMVAVDPREDHVHVEVDVVGVVVEHAGECGPALAVALDARQHGIQARDAAAGERVGSRRDDLELPERPELEPHRGLGGSPSRASLADAASVQQEEVGILAGQPPEAEQPLRPLAAAIHARVERFVDEGFRERGFDLRAFGAVDRDDGSVVVAAHEQVGDGEPVECCTDEAQVIRHRVRAGDAG